MFNEDEHQKPIHKLFYLITGTCNCGVRIRVPPPTPAEASASRASPGARRKAQRAGHVHARTRRPAGSERAKPPATSDHRARARAFAAIGVAVLAAGLAWRPTAAAVASVVLVAASCVFIT